VGGGEAAAAVAAVAPAVATAQLDVMKLSVAQLKAELKKRGRVTGGNKSVLQVRLKEAIDLNVPVSEEAGGDEAPRPDFMAGLDVTARWELLTRCDDPVPESDNDDGSLRPTTEMNAAVNPKYGFVETFSCIPFTGTTEKMRYCCPDGRSVNRLRWEKKRWHSASMHTPSLTCS
jgi:hypothetical protein